MLAAKEEALATILCLKATTDSKDLGASDASQDIPVEHAVLQFIPSIRSGSFVDIDPRRYIEDEHICIDDLSAHLGSVFICPTPSAFYGVFDGHGGPDAAAYIKRHATRVVEDLLEDPVIAGAIDEEIEFNALVEEEAALLESLLGER